MHTDAFSFEVENEGVVYNIKILELHAIPKFITWIKLLIKNSDSTASIIAEMNWHRMMGEYIFDHKVSFIPLSRALEQKISDKIISRNE